MRKYLTLLFVLCGTLLQAADQKTLTLYGGLNQPFEHWSFPNNAARIGATGFFSQDIGKIGYQADSQMYYRLSGPSPTWIPVNGNGVPMTNKGDTDYTVTDADMIVRSDGTGWGSNHSYTLPPAANAHSITFVDQGSIGSSNFTLTIARSGSDLIYPGAATQLQLSRFYQGVTLTSDQVNKWFVTSFQPGIAGTAGQFVNSTGQNVWGSSLYSLPVSAPTLTAGKFLITNAAGGPYVHSIPAFPSQFYTGGLSGTNGQILFSNGTNLILDYPNMNVASIASVSGSYAADTYLTGSPITIAANSWAAGRVYHCVFDMTKTAAGVGTIVINVRLGTNATTADASIVSQTYAAGTAAADTGWFDIYVTFRTVGTGTSAVVSMSSKIDKTLTTTGLINSPNITLITPGTISAGFSSQNGQSKIGLSFNGGTSFSGTNTFCNCEYK